VEHAGLAVSALQLSQLLLFKMVHMYPHSYLEKMCWDGSFRFLWKSGKKW